MNGWTWTSAGTQPVFVRLEPSGEVTLEPETEARELAELEREILAEPREERERPYRAPDRDPEMWIPAKRRRLYAEQQQQRETQRSVFVGGLLGLVVGLGVAAATLGIIRAIAQAPSPAIRPTQIKES